jgi:hypothetical protein
MCFISHDQAVHLFPEESFIRGRSLVNTSGQIITYLPWGHYNVPQVSLVPFEEPPDMASCRSLVSCYLSHQAAGESPPTIGLDYHHPRKNVIPSIPRFISQACGSEDSVKLFCLGSVFVFDKDQDHAFFAKQRQFQGDRHAWRQPIWSRYALAPTYVCGIQKRLSLQYDSLHWSFNLMPHWPVPHEMTIGSGYTLYEELTRDMVHARCYAGSFQGQTFHLEPGFEDVSINLSMF